MSFFAPPALVETRVFTSLPSKYRNLRRNNWTRANAPSRDLHSILEGPAFDQQGRLYVTDVPFGRIFRIDPQGQWELVAEYDGWPNGIKIDDKGRIVITDYKNGIVELNPDTGRITPIVEDYLSEGFKGVNDLFFTSNGDLYFTDQGQTGLQDPTGRVFKLSAQGVLTKLIDCIPSPNGLVVDEKRNVLYVAVTRANQIWRVPLHANGETSKVSIFAHLHGGPGGPDGLALDEAGGLLVAHAGFGTVWRLTALAEPVARINTAPGLIPTNVAFGGAERKQLYITEAEEANILVADVEIPGLPLLSHAPEKT